MMDKNVGRPSEIKLSGLRALVSRKISIRLFTVRSAYLLLYCISYSNLRLTCGRVRFQEKYKNGYFSFYPLMCYRSDRVGEERNIYSESIKIMEKSLAPNDYFHYFIFEIETRSNSPISH